MEFTPQNLRWVALRTPLGENLPEEGWTVLARLKAGAILRVEKVPNLPKKQRPGQKKRLKSDFYAYGYRYGTNRFYLPLYRCSVNIREAVDYWAISRLAATKYYNGSGREGEEHLLSAEE